MSAILMKSFGSHELCVIIDRNLKDAILILWLIWCLNVIVSLANYRKISNIRRTKSPNLNVSRLVLQLSLPIPMKPGVKTPKGDAPTTSGWSIILLPTKVRLILET